MLFELLQFVYYEVVLFARRNCQAYFYATCSFYHAQKTTLGHLRFELLHTQSFTNPDLFDLSNSKALFEHLPEPLRDSWNNIMESSEEAMDIREMITKEVV